MKRLRWHDLVSVNLFWLGLNIRNNAVGAIYMPYLVDQFVRPEIRNTALGEMRTAGLVIAMLIQPAMGLLSDRSTSRWGRRRPFIAVGVLLDLVCLGLIAVAPDYWTLLVAILLLQFSSNVSHGALQGLIPDLVPEDRRGAASSVKAIFELLPLALIGVTIAPLVAAGRFGPSVVVTGLLLSFAALATLVLAKESPLTTKPVLPLMPAMIRVLGMLAGIGVGAVAGLAAGGAAGGAAGLVTRVLAGPAAAMAVGVAVGGIVAMVTAVVAGVWAGSLATIGREVRRRPSFTWWTINRLMFLAAITSIQGFAPYFLMYAFRVSGEVAAGMTGTLMAVVGAFTLVSTVLSGWLADRMGQKRLVFVSGLLAALGTLVLLATIWVPNLGLIYTTGCILGLAAGLFVTSNWALGTRLVPASEAGRYLGIANLAGAGAGMIGTGIGGPVADYLNGSLPGLGYFAIFAGYGLLFLLSAVSLRWVTETSPSAGGRMADVRSGSWRRIPWPVRVRRSRARR
ncbi:MAG: MFS transporter [Chloroflexi bacterium]|nr:MAG: MFS transporter [Chloroflexota bacterium]